jgi:translation initiation factor 4G
LTQDLIALSLNSKEERLKGAIDIIFEKAIDEPNYSQTYAQVCVNLSKTKLQKGDTQVTFRSILLNRCQKEFHTDYYKEINYDQWMKSRLNETSKCLVFLIFDFCIFKDIEECSDEIKKRELQEQLDERLTKAKRRSLGNIRFVEAHL